MYNYFLAFLHLLNLYYMIMFSIRLQVHIPSFDNKILDIVYSMLLVVIFLLGQFISLYARVLFYCITRAKCLSTFLNDSDYGVYSEGELRFRLTNLSMIDTKKESKH